MPDTTRPITTNTSARAASPPLTGDVWLLLIGLSVLWGGSFLFIGIAAREVPPLTLVLSRCVLAALVLVPIVVVLGYRLPRGWRAWQPFLVMSILNNVIPFTLIVFGQTQITAGLASVINATTPLWAVLLAHALTADDKLTARRLAGLLIGIAGVAILVGPALGTGAVGELVGILAVLVATLCYGFAGVWARRLRDTPPLVSAASQLICSSLVLLPLALAWDRPWLLALPSGTAMACIAALAVLSTAIAYVIFYRIIAISGPSNAMLVTLLIPVSAIALGSLVLGETIRANQIAGAVLIASALLVIDGRVLAWLTPQR